MRRGLVAKGACVLTPIHEAGLLAYVESLVLRNTRHPGNTESDPLMTVFRQTIAVHESFVRAIADGATHDFPLDVGAIVDDVLLLLWRALPAFVDYDATNRCFRVDLAESEIRAWLAKATRNVGNNARRIARRHRAKLEKLACSEFRATARSASQAVEARDTLEYMVRGFAALERDVFIDGGVHGMSDDEIGGKHGISAARAKQIQRNVIKVLRQGS
jgi:DNA-directed RNA polymerase specialized sigma24 family protein